MTYPTPSTVAGWQRHFRDQIDQARRTHMTPVDRERLVSFLRKEAGSIFYGPEDDAWADTGYRRA
jgi:hypothetical protein